MDRDGNGTVSFEEFAAVCTNTTDEIILLNLFTRMDTNQSGTISRQEMMNAIRGDPAARETLSQSPNLAPLLKPRGFDQLFKAVDADGSGDITFEVC